MNLGRTLVSKSLRQVISRVGGKSQGGVALSQVCRFQTSPRRQIPPIVWMLVKPVMKITAALTGRGVRKWWQKLPSEQKKTLWTRMKQNWPVFGLMGAGTGVWCVYYYESHKVPAPVTGRKRFIVVTHEQLMKIAEAEAQVNLDKYQGNLLPVNHPVVKKVTKIVSRLLGCNRELQDMHVTEWKVTVIDDGEFNAFVVPNGHIFVYTGLLKMMQNEDQLAMVLGHEMAHALLSHSAEKLSFAQVLDVMIISVMAAIWTVMPNDGIAIITQWFYHKVIDLMLHMPYSRLLEKEADKVGMQLAARACYDVREGSVFWKRTQMIDDLEGSSTPEWLSTHPAHQKRVEHIDFLVPDAIKLRESCECGPLPKMDPRNRDLKLQDKVDNIVTARKAGQNLKKVNIVK